MRSRTRKRYSSDRLVPTMTWVERLPPPSGDVAVGAIQRSHLATLGERTFSCAVVQTSVSAPRCLELQFHPKCLGCSAASHFCHACRHRPLKFPELELCEPCLLYALACELEQGPVFAPHHRCVTCQRQDRTILVSICLDLQAKGVEGCRGCDQASRKCERCKLWSVCYPEDGWCRSCAVKEYGKKAGAGEALLALVSTPKQRRAILAQTPPMRRVELPAQPAGPAVSLAQRPTVDAVKLAVRVGRYLVSEHEAGRTVSVSPRGVVHRACKITIAQAKSALTLLAD